MTLDQIRARLQAATPGPWEARELAYSTCVGVVGDYRNLARLGDPLNQEAWRNAVFIAAAPTDILALLNAVDAALAACDRVIDNADGHKPPGPPNPTREQATAVRIRAAITAALEDEG